MAENDLVADILQRIIEKHAKLPETVAQAIELEVRRDWGGERHYIAKVGESGKAQLAIRDARIYADHRRGEHEELLARRWGISIRRVRQIIRAAETAALIDPVAANDDGNGLP